MRDLIDHYENDYYAEPGELRPWLLLTGRDKAANVRELWTGQPPVSVADIGCGDGAVLVHLDRAGFGQTYTGFEISASAIALAEETEFRRPARFIAFDGISLPADDREFDLAVVSHVVEHAADPRGLVAEAARIAKWVFIEVPLELNARTPHDFAWDDLGHINLFNAKILRHLVQSVGLDVIAERVTLPGRDVSVHQHGSYVGLLHWTIKRSALAARVGTRLFTYHGSILATH